MAMTIQTILWEVLFQATTTNQEEAGWVYVEEEEGQREETCSLKTIHSRRLSNS
jgi:hypothetical protein